MTKFPRSPRRLDWIYDRDPLYLITCCTYRRRPLLANNRVHAAFVEFSETAQNDFGIAIGRYVILPDHFYFFVAIPEDLILGKWVGTLKRVLGKVMECVESEDPIGQRGFFDHVLRSGESYSQKWDYMRENPVRAGLVENADDWPYAGEIVPIRYH